MKTNNKEQRRFSLEDNFMKGNINDLIYGKLQSLSYLSENKERFVFSADFNQNEMAELLQMPIATFKRHFKALQTAGFVVKGKAKDTKGKDKSCFYLPYNVNERYKLIPATTLGFLMDVCKPNVIKTYLYLLDKYDWKRKTNEMYSFTNEELMLAIGLKTNYSPAYEEMRNILLNLTNNGLIEYSEFYYNGKIPNKRLTKVNLVVKGLEKETEKEIKEEKRVEETNFSRTLSQSALPEGDFKF